MNPNLIPVLKKHERATELRAAYKGLMTRAAQKHRYDLLEGLMHRGSREVHRVLGSEA